MSVQDVLKYYETNAEQGLASESAAKLLSHYGRNLLPQVRKQPSIVRFLLQFHNVLIYILLVAGVGKLLLQEWIDASVIFGVVIINAMLGFLQEGKAEKALDAIRGMLCTQATVLRNGRQSDVNSEELVPGDVVLLESGDKVPADLRLITARNLRVEEAALTGESVPVNKGVDSVSANCSLGDRTCMTYSGTLVVSGCGTGVVVATGSKTELGKINRMLGNVKQLETPLLAQIKKFAVLVSVVILVISAITFTYGVFVRGFEVVAMFKAMVGIAVAAIPEGLPAIITITLAIGVQRMASRRSIIRRLPAVETLGSVTRICSDKTGTLTKNEMTVMSLITSRTRWKVTGTGYDPKGQVVAENRNDTFSTHGIKEAALIAALCNDARLVQKDEGWKIEGNPTEGALLPFAIKCGADLDALRAELPRVDVIPFESVHKYMATLHKTAAADFTLLVKGAPEVVMNSCLYQLSANGAREALEKTFWDDAAHSLAAGGQRVLALAWKQNIPQRPENFDAAWLPQDLTLVGLVGIMDPPREEAIQAVAECHAGGIRVTMITGDHALTAASIAARLGIGDGTKALTGAQLEMMSDEELLRASTEVDVFARTSPEHKLRLVRACQQRNDVVAMTGDGVNDAPALKQADVGVAMGIKGTEVTKEAADMVILDDNFASITTAVREGRTVYNNIEKAILFILPTNGGQGLTIMAAVFAGMTLPITAPQILWINMVTSVTLALALSFEPHEQDVMRRPPREVKRPLLDAFGMWRIAFISVLILGATFLTFWFMKMAGQSLEMSRTAAVNALIICQVAYLLNSRCKFRSAIHAGILSGNIWLPLSILAIILLQVLFTYAPWMNGIFGTEPLPGETWLWLLLAGVAFFLSVELEKWIIRKFVKIA